MIPLLCAVVLQAQAALPFSKPISIAEPNRLAITPMLDGKLSAEEWDPFTSDEKVKTYLDWLEGEHVPVRTGRAGRTIEVEDGIRLELLAPEEPLLANTAPDYAPRPEYRPLTKFEQRGLRLGHDVWDIVFTRV